MTSLSVQGETMLPLPLPTLKIILSPCLPKSQQIGTPAVIPFPFFQTILYIRYETLSLAIFPSPFIQAVSLHFYSPLFPPPPTYFLFMRSCR
jgi:hypothetical protein